MPSVRWRAAKHTATELWSSGNEYCGVANQPSLSCSLMDEFLMPGECYLSELCQLRCICITEFPVCSVSNYSQAFQNHILHGKLQTNGCFLTMFLMGLAVPSVWVRAPINKYPSIHTTWELMPYLHGNNTGLINVLLKIWIT